MNSPEIDDKWLTGSNKKVSFKEVCDTALSLAKDNTKIFIGTDSGISKDEITFCKAICIHGIQSHSLYFFRKYKISVENFPNILARVMEETRLSVEVAEFLTTKYNIPLNKIELHVDVSSCEMNTKTSKYSDMLQGYVSGAGFHCKIKPDAWASQTVADRHSK